MRSLVLISVMAIGISFLPLSQEETSVFYFQVPAQNSEANSEVNNDACGGYVAQNLLDTFHVQNTNESESSDSTYKDTYYAFGVVLNSNSAI
ncbi:MAG: hypothetical protein WD000_02475 [Thermodesulfobacteriota bacterium]